MDTPLATDLRIIRLHLGRVELDASWEGGFAFRPLDIDDPTSSIGAARYAWSGTVYEVDAEAGDIFVGLTDSSGAPTPGDFIIKPFEFTRFLHDVYQQIAGGAADRAASALGLAAGKHAPSRIQTSRLGVSALENLWGHRWSILWGPPGTGKTYSLGEFVAAASTFPKERILVVSTTNKATDGAALSIVNAMRRRSPTPDLAKILRIGAGADLTRYREADATGLLSGGETAIRSELNAKRRMRDRATKPEERAALKRDIEALQKQLKEADLALFDPEHQVVVATAFKAVQILAEAEQSPANGGTAPFTTLVIDEAGLVSRAATAALALHAEKRVVLVGDPRQLAPISRVARIEEPRRRRWLGESGLAHLTPATLTASMVMLTTQWRMAPEIRELVSNYRYDGRLVDAPSILGRASDANLDKLFESQPRALWYVLDEEATSLAACRGQRPERGGSWHRPITIDVLQQVFDAHPKLARGPGLFVSPFVAQGREVRQWLAKHPVAHEGWRASTVHAQQGAEADYVIFDTVQASSTAWPKHEWERLVNVGLSRAKELVLLIASRDEMQQPFLAPLVGHIAPRVLRGSRSTRIRWEPVPAQVAHERSAGVRASDPTSLGAQLDDRGSMLPLLSAEQERLCNLKMDGGPRLVRGVAGSGKTVVMASWVARTLEQKPRGVLWVVYGNAALRGLLNSMVGDALQQRGLDPATRQVSYFHIKELLDLLLKMAGVRYKGDQFDYNAQAARYLSEVGSPQPLCDAVFVDEGQDMGPETIRLLHGLVKPVDAKRTRRQAVIFFDNAQNIYGRGTPQWSDLGIDMRGRSTVMKESFRSTRPVTEFALNMLYRLLPPQDDPDHRELLERGLVVKDSVGKRPWWRVRFCHVEGPQPRVEFFDSRESEVAALGRQIESWIRDEGVRPRAIRDVMVHFQCVHYNKANGTACDTDGDPCTADSCYAGTCLHSIFPPLNPPPEFCFNDIDDDCDGLVDELDPNGVGDCEGPRGVYETRDIHKLGPAPIGGGTTAAGDTCNWSSECESRNCMPSDNPAERPRCAKSNCTTFPSSWDVAYVEGFCGPNHVIWGELLCVPSIPGWIDTHSGVGNNTGGESCRFNSDCATGFGCYRNGQIGMCGSDSWSSCSPDEYTISFDNWSCYYCNQAQLTRCIPIAVLCNAYTPADNCTYYGDHWECQ